MSPFAPRLLRTFTATHLGNESALRQGECGSQNSGPETVRRGR
jgi:hypothetical protein